MESTSNQSSFSMPMTLARKTPDDPMVPTLLATSNQDRMSSIAATKFGGFQHAGARVAHEKDCARMWDTFPRLVFDAPSPLRLHLPPPAPSAPLLLLPPAQPKYPLVVSPAPPMSPVAPESPLLLPPVASHEVEPTDALASFVAIEPLEPLETHTGVIPYHLVVAQPIDASHYSCAEVVANLREGLDSIKGTHSSVGKYVTSMRIPEIEKAKLFFACNIPDKSQEFNALINKYNHTADKYNSATQEISKKLGYVPNGTTMLQHMRYCIVLAMVEIHAKNATQLLEASGAGVLPSVQVSKVVDAFLDEMIIDFKIYVHSTEDGRKTTGKTGIRKGPFAHSMNLSSEPARTFAAAFQVFTNVCKDIDSALIVFENGEDSRIRSWLKRAAAHRNTDAIKDALREFLSVSDELYESEFAIMQPAIKRQRQLAHQPPAAETEPDTDDEA